MNLPSQTRALLYSVIAVLSPVVFYLGEQGTISNFWTGLFSVVVTAVSALAFSNVNPDV